MIKASSVELKWFWKYAELFLSDEEVCAGSEQPIFYWDTADVHGALLGYRDFYDRQGGFNKAQFNSPTSLVRSLLAAGWFDEIRLVHPHQSELMSHLDELIRHGPRHNPPGGPEMFLRRALPKLAPASGQQKIGEKDIQLLIRNQSSAAEDLFKALQSITPWDARLREWTKHGRLRFDLKDSFDYTAALKSDEFNVIRNMLDRSREDVPLNNFTDAMALCYLDWLLRKSLADKSPIPLRFVGNSLLREATESLENKEFLHYRNQRDERVPILRGPEFYLIRASLWPPKLMLSRGGGDPIKILTAMRDEIRDSAGVMSHQDIPDVQEFIEIRDSLARQIVELKRLWFLQRVWLPYADQEFAKIAEQYLKETRLLISKQRNENILGRDIEEIRREFDQGARKYALARQLWNAIYGAAMLLRDRYSALSVKPPRSAAKLFGLVRFGLDPSVEEAVQDDFMRIALSTSEDSRNVSARLAAVAYECLQERPPEARSLLEALVVFWMLHLDTQINRIVQVALENESLRKLIPIYIIQGAALVRREEPRAATYSVIKKLEDLLKDMSDSQGRAQVMSGIGYLQYHLWSKRGGIPFWHPVDPSSASTPQVVADLAVDAIRWAHEALKEAKVNSDAYVYALNQVVYYTTEAGPGRSFLEVDEYAQRLISCRGNDRIWQYRFDDTLARYFHRRYLLDDGAMKDSYWERTMYYINQARQNGFDDDEIEVYYTFLLAN